MSHIIPNLAVRWSMASFRLSLFRALILQSTLLKSLVLGSLQNTRVYYVCIKVDEIVYLYVIELGIIRCIVTYITLITNCLVKFNKLICFIELCLSFLSIELRI